MKQLIGTRRNYFLVELDSGKFEPTVEFILTASEPTYEVGQGSEIVKAWTSETLRFTMTKKSLALLMDTLAEIKDDLDRMDAPEKTPVKKQKTLFETPEKKADE